jgi:hypothetical protein
VAFTSAYTPGNFEVFLVPAFVMSWLLAAAGAQLAVDRTSSRLNRPSGAVLAGVLALLPVWQWTRNYDTRDLSHDRADMRFFDALFERLPDRAALLHEDFLVDRMVYYKTLGEYAGRSRDLLALVPSQLEPVARASRDRREVFAFPAAATLMRLMDGAEFSYSPFEVSGGSLARYLDDLPHGTMVAVGVPAKHLGRFMTANGALPLEAIGFRRALGGLVMNVAVIGTAGGHDGAGSVDRIAAQIRRDAPPAASGPRIASIEVHADLESAAIVYGGREIIRTTTGVAVATWRSGRLTAAFSIPASTGVPPLLLPGTAVYQLLEIRQRQSIGPEPLDLTAETSTGSFVYTTGSGGLSRFVLYVGSTRPLSPALLECSAPQWPALDVDEFAGEGRAEPLALALQGDGLPVDQRLLALPHVYRIAVVADWAGAIGVRVGLGGVPGVAYGRQSTGASGFIYGVNLATHLARIDERLLALQMANNHHSHLIGAGWSSVQADGIGPYRETLARDAGLLIPLEAARSIRVGVQLLSLAGVSPATVDLRFGERQVGMPVAVTPAWRRYWWDVPAEYVRSGVNEMFVSISPDAGRIAVSDVLIERMD